MADDAARSRLGRGLASLMGDVGVRPTPPSACAASAACRSNSCAPIRAIRANCFRKPSWKICRRRSASAASFSRSWCAAAAPMMYEIIAGERRWRAAQRAGMHEVPIVVIEASDGEALELAIIENVQRTDLNPLEEATGYQVLAAEFDHSQDEIAKIVGKSRSHVANTLRLLKLPDTVKAYINAGKLSAGHARALINQPDPEARRARDRCQGSQRPPGRSAWPGAGRGCRQGCDDARAHRQGLRYGRAGETIVRCVGPRGWHRPSRQRRRSPGALSHAGTARRRDPPPRKISRRSKSKARHGRACPGHQRLALMYIKP